MIKLMLLVFILSSLVFFPIICSDDTVTNTNPTPSPTVYTILPLPTVTPLGTIVPVVTQVPDPCHGQPCEQ